MEYANPVNLLVRLALLIRQIAYLACISTTPAIIIIYRMFAMQVSAPTATMEILIVIYVINAPLFAQLAQVALASAAIVLFLYIREYVITNAPKAPIKVQPRA
jgi:hypothetical protein